MAKHRKQKKKVSQDRRLEKPEVDENVRQERILPIIASLKSPNLAERTVTLGALANIIEDPKMRHMLLRERLVHVLLSNTLSDSSLELVAEGFGVLRNIVLSEGRGTALFLVREQVRLPLIHVATKSKAALMEIGSLDKQRLAMLNQMVENIFGLVTAIVVALGELIDVEEVSLLAFGVISMKTDKLLKQTYDAAVEVLYYLSEDNDELLKFLFSENRVQVLRSTALELNSWQAKVYEVGIECNFVVINDRTEASTASYLASQLVTILTEVPRTETNSLQVCLELLALLAQSEDADIIRHLQSEAVPQSLDLIADPQYSLRSVSFINNVGWALNGLKENWSSMADLVFNRALESCLNVVGDDELLSSTLGLLGSALTQNPRLINDERLLKAFPTLFERIDSLYREGDEEWIALASALVNLLGNTAAHIGLISQTSDLIFSLLEHTENIQSQIDALNALFDLFGDNDASFNQVEYKDKQLNKKLEQMRPNIKRVLKSAGKADPIRDQADDALHNLDNFIMYKRG